MVFGFVLREDGSTTRPTIVKETQAGATIMQDVTSHDIVVDETLGIWVRVYVPNSLGKNSKKGPLVAYFHGGGFILNSVSNPVFHNFNSKMASSIQAVIVSVEYRLAPEHRLPAAYEDCNKVITWLQDVSKGSLNCSFLVDAADFSKLILMGDSAGGNITHHVARKCCSMDISPLKLLAAVLIQPFFGGVSRLNSEERLSSGPIVSLDILDLCWEWSLPLGANRDHPFSNVLMNLRKSLDEIPTFPSSLVIVGSMDPLHDYGVEYARILEASSKRVKLVEFDVTHGFLHLGEDPETGGFFAELNNFMEEYLT